MNRISKTKGFTLLEVMVGLIIFSIGLLGLAGLQAQSLNFNNSASLRSTATYLAYDIIDRMRNNTDEVLTSSYNIDTATVPGSVSNTCDTAISDCSPGELRQLDHFQWKEAIGKSLPQGKGSIATTISGSRILVSVYLEWFDKLSSGNTSTLTINTELAPSL